MKKNQHGFGAIEGLLLLVIVSLIGFVGWYVWQSKNKRLTKKRILFRNHKVRIQKFHEKNEKPAP